MTIAHESPILKSIVLNMIRSVHFKEFRYSNRELIDVESVPKISENILFSRGFRESSFNSLPKQNFILPPFKSPNKENKKGIGLKKPEPPKEIAPSVPQGFQESIIEKDKSPSDSLNPRLKVSSSPPRIQMVSLPIEPSNSKQSRPIPIVPINLFQNPSNYGKLYMLIKDPFVAFIECPGPKEKLIVTKRGQKQQTNIILAKEEIQMLLNNVSARTKIPLLTGVFRVSWDNFIINAIISDSLEPRFLIKRI